jgi:DNA adenine methylase
MVQFDSPLRYPGGKRKLAQFIADVVIQNGIQGGTYIEPFAGGASVALYLLFKEYVNQIIINDFDRSIYAFWYSVINYTDELCRKIQDTKITVEEWEKQRRLQNRKNQVELLDLGFSTFFLNRTNRSGIIKGGIIGGKQQNGKWKIDTRFNKENLIKRIEKVALYKQRITVFNEDAIAFLDDIIDSINAQTLIYFDPPYYNHGFALYVNYYTNENHFALSKYIQGLGCTWILTYDYAPQIVEMYKNARKKLLILNYTAAKKEKGYEMLAFSNNLIIPSNNYSSIVIE